MENDPKPVRWIGTSLKDLRSFPAAVRRDIGQALFTAQQGETDPAAKPLTGFAGASVMEIVASRHGNAWRAVYVLHAFQKKSTKGIATPARDIELIRKRLAEAVREHRERQN